MPEESEPVGGIDEEYLTLIHQAFAAYERSGDAFERARLVSAMGKTHAPRLLEEVERLRNENARLRAALRPLLALFSPAEIGSEAGFDALLADLIWRQTLRAALQTIAEEQRG
jgi:hypothetical protein